EWLAAALSGDVPLTTAARREGGPVAEAGAAAPAAGATTVALATAPSPHGEDVRWDPIVEVRPLGEAPVYDLTVPGPHNFLAEGIYVHNSIEQDADIVMFIYREDVYDPETDKKGIAEVIVAKHRHGPTDTISLRFFDRTARFADLELYRGDPSL
ncbi:MAG: hypothetical protein IRY97_05345, partial [Thermomicrobiaceae bacterium]|nr:hypothetical protein [Thermomicrobiaceae bacterium]